MDIPCRSCINPKSCTYRCEVKETIDPDCFNCAAYKALEGKELRIEGLKKEAIRYKDRSDKYDEIVRAYSEGLIKTVTKAFMNTLME